MKVSYDWLQSYFAQLLPEPDTLAHALTFHAFEIESVENMVLDVKVTANRGHDCLSHRGIARELSAILNTPVSYDPLRQAVSLAPQTDWVLVELKEPALCQRYIAGYIRGVEVGPSPAWLAKRLESIGQRSINNVVDATNYVMFGLGQPLHAFDASRLQQNDGGYFIEVRKARAGEHMLALDNKEYELSDTMLVISDGNADEAIGIAGVKGGSPAGITEATTDIIIESANFDGASVRRTAAALRLRTDASARFEQGISPEMAASAMQEVVKLIRELAGGELVGYADVYPVVADKKEVSVTVSKINAVLGTTYSQDSVAQAFTRLDLAHVQEGDTFTIKVPYERLDLAIPEDLIEEVARIIGYDTVPATELPPVAETPAVDRDFTATDRLRAMLVQRGFSEVLTSVFAEEGDVAVLNKVDSVRPYLRRDLLTGLRDALDKNIRIKDLVGVRQVKLFEIGTVWRGGEETVMLGLAVEKLKKQKTAIDYLADVASEIGVTVAPVPEEVVEIPLAQLVEHMVGESYTEVLLPRVRYQQFSKYPFIVRDIAMWVPSATSEESVRKIIRTHAGELLVRTELFDRFEKDGRVSYAFRLVFQSPDRTLFDEDATERMAAVTEALKKEGFEIR